jgi:hypothetical protein
MLSTKYQESMNCTKTVSFSHTRTCTPAHIHSLTLSAFIVTQNSVPVEGDLVSCRLDYEGDI